MAFTTDLLVNPLFVAVISASIGIFGTYLAAIQKYRKDLEAQFDKSLREERVKVYPKLWRQLSSIPFASGMLTIDALDKVKKSLHEWYSEDGIYLSDSSREFLYYFYDQLSSLNQTTIPRDSLREEDRNLQEMASMLQKSLADDLGAGRDSIFNRQKYKRFWRGFFKI